MNQFNDFSTVCYYNVNQLTWHSVLVLLPAARIVEPLGGAA